MSDGLWLQVLFGGMTTGSVYALVALGLVLIYRATRVLNFAHGEFVVLGAFVAISAMRLSGWGLLVSSLIGIAAAACSGVLLEILVVRPVSRNPHFVVILATLAASILLRGAMMIVWGKDALRLPSFSGDEPIRIAGAAILPQTLWVIGMASAVVIALAAFLKFTPFGKAIRACAENPVSAALAGINVRTMIMLSYALAAGIGGLAGVVISPIAGLDFQMGLMLAIKGLTAAVIGGLESFYGVVLGGLLLGIIEAYGSAFVSSVLKDALAFALLIAVLILRPQGLLGKRAR
jgi:branched-chain amino acid transport system permease protein